MCEIRETHVTQRVMLSIIEQIHFLAGGLTKS